MCFSLKKTVPFTQPWTQSDNINNAQATYSKRSHFTCYTFLRSPHNFGQQIYCKIIRCLLATRASIWSRGPVMKRSCVGSRWHSKPYLPLSYVIHKNLLSTLLLNTPTSFSRFLSSSVSIEGTVLDPESPLCNKHSISMSLVFLFTVAIISHHCTDTSLWETNRNRPLFISGAACKKV